MGRNYSFEVIFEAPNVNAVLSGLSDVLIADDRRRIHRSLPWKPEHIIRMWIPDENRLFRVQCGIKGVRDPTHETSEGDYHFSLHMPLSGNLRRLIKKHIPGVLVQDRNQAYIDIGSVWTSLRVGSRCGLLTLTAVGTSMSLLFQESIEIQQALVNALESCTRTVLLYDYEGWEDETEEITILHPWHRKVRPWDLHQARVVYEYSDEDVQYKKDLGLDPDRYATQVWGRVEQASHRSR